MKKLLNESQTLVLQGLIDKRLVTANNGLEYATTRTLNQILCL